MDELDDCARDLDMEVRVIGNTGVAAHGESGTRG